mmetsp:Transcript_26661/g.70105  ORF Transcript_26661/g.70105 Transcript_26661/m.70105 type:complete len:128 (-) Transcript_26661:12-395(-)
MIEHSWVCATGISREMDATHPVPDAKAMLQPLATEIWPLGRTAGLVEFVVETGVQGMVALERGHLANEQECGDHHHWHLDLDVHRCGKMTTAIESIPRLTQSVFPESGCHRGARVVRQNLWAMGDED